MIGCHSTMYTVVLLSITCFKHDVVTLGDEILQRVLRNNMTLKTFSTSLFSAQYRFTITYVCILLFIFTPRALRF